MQWQTRVHIKPNKGTQVEITNQHPNRRAKQERSESTALNADQLPNAQTRHKANADCLETIRAAHKWRLASEP